MACVTCRQGQCIECGSAPSMLRFGQCGAQAVSMENLVAQINFPLEEMTEVKRIKVACLTEEARLAEAARRAKAANFAAALAERNQKKPPNHH
ncbi:hypothetical protein HAX54_026850 [Datura stramonium]|uniref:Uncharacterized protein n=1 Tax=Datura stramonium TaxID=4076 RepID=A0ABS8V1T8_DATST|nr:hypothetical protein [Datura stramonium]